MFDNKDISCPQCTSVSIDTLRLRLTGFTVARAAMLTVEQPPVVAGRKQPGRLLYEAGGFPVYGTKATARCPSGAWELEVKPYPKEKVYARVLLHVPQFCFGHNLQAATWDDLIHALRTVERSLCRIGVLCGLQDAYLSRVDLSRNVVLEMPFRSYQPVLQVLMPRSGMKPQPYFGTGVLWRNKRTEALAVYDARQKALEQAKQWPLPWPHVARLETRLFGWRKILSVLGTRRINVLCARHVLLPDVFRRQMRLHLFTVDMNALPKGGIVRRDLIPRFLMAYQRADRRARPRGRAYMALALRLLLEGGMSVEEITREDRAVFGTGSRSRRSLEQLCQVAAGTLPEPITGRSYADLYAELRDKALA